MKVAPALLIGLASVALAACGSSDDSGGIVTSNVPINLQAPGTTVAFNADAASATTTTAGGVTGSRIDAASSANTVTITSDEDGNLSDVVLTVVTPGANFTQSYTSFLPLTGLTLAQIVNQIQSVAVAAGNSVFVIQQQAQAQALNYSAYGVWDSNDGGGTGRFGVVAFGVPTAATAMPATGTATYNGTTVGIAASTSATSVLTGNAQLSANFAAATVTTSFSNLTTQNTVTNATGTLPNLAGTSGITGNAFAGPLAGGTLAGTVNGHFYGPAAQETAGTWNVSGGGLTALGSFGAR